MRNVLEEKTASKQEWNMAEKYIDGLFGTVSGIVYGNSNDYGSSRKPAPMESFEWDVAVAWDWKLYPYVFLSYLLAVYDKYRGILRGCRIFSGSPGTVCGLCAEL